MDEYEVNCIMAIGDIFCDEKLKGTIRLAKIDAVRQLHGLVRGFLNHFMRKELVQAVWEKKLAFIREANTKAELQQIMRPSVPKPSGAGKLVPASPYHIEEEELLFWATVTPNHNVVPEAQERYRTLFRKFYPKQAEDAGI